MLEYFPEGFLKNRLMNKGYRVMGPVWQSWLRRSMSAPGTRLERLGSDYGGWYFPVDVARPDWIIYSGGVGQDSSFDEAVMERFGCTVHMFDPTPHAIEHVEARKALNAALTKHAVFKPVGLWRENTTLKFFAPRTNGWVGAPAVEPTCPTTGAGWGGGGRRWATRSLPYSLVAALLSRTGGWSHTKDVGSGTWRSTSTALRAGASRSQSSSSSRAQ